MISWLICHIAIAKSTTFNVWRMVRYFECGAKPVSDLHPRYTSIDLQQPPWRYPIISQRKQRSHRFFYLCSSAIAIARKTAFAVKAASRPRLYEIVRAQSADFFTTGAPATHHILIYLFYSELKRGWDIWLHPGFNSIVKISNFYYDQNGKIGYSFQALPFSQNRWYFSAHKKGLQHRSCSIF